MTAGEEQPAADGRKPLAEAIRVLTAAARLTHQPLHQTAPGVWEPDPSGPPSVRRASLLTIQPG